MLNKSWPALLTLALPLPSLASDGLESRAHEVKTFGTRSGAAVAAGNPMGTNIAEAGATVKVLGQTLNAFNTQVDAGQVGIDGVAYTTINAFGKTVLADAFSVSSSGVNNIRLGLAPTEVRVPIVTYPVGPLLLNVGGGARFLAGLSATLVPEVAIPIETSTLGVQLSAEARAAAFVEAYGSLVFLRGGVGGQVDLLDGRLDVNGRLAFDNSKPALLVNGIIHFLKGRFYAFLDLAGILSPGWTRLIDEDLYRWNGICKSMGHLQCPAK